MKNTITLLTSILSVTLHAQYAQEANMQLARNAAGTWTITSVLNNPTTLSIPAYKDGVPITHISAMGTASNLQSIYGVNITNIGPSAFANLSNLKTVAFPNVVTIQTAAFQNCTNLLGPFNFYILQQIGDAAFKNCTNLREVDCASVRQIGAEAFENSSAKILLENY